MRYFHRGALMHEPGADITHALALVTHHCGSCTWQERPLGLRLSHLPFGRCPGCGRPPYGEGAPTETYFLPPAPSLDATQQEEWPDCPFVRQAFARAEANAGGSPTWPPPPGVRMVTGNYPDEVGMSSGSSDDEPADDASALTADLRQPAE